MSSSQVWIKMKGYTKESLAFHAPHAHFYVNVESNVVAFNYKSDYWIYANDMSLRKNLIEIATSKEERKNTFEVLVDDPDNGNNGAILAIRRVDVPTATRGDYKHISDYGIF